MQASDLSGRYICLRLTIAAGAEDELAGALNRDGVLGAEVASDPVVSGGRELVSVSVYADPARLVSLDSLCEAVQRCAVEPLEVFGQDVEDWLAVYRDGARPFPVGESWWIDPHPADPTPAPEGRTPLMIEPRMAFGTGGHESTALILQELERLDLTGRSVLDIGTGSSILAVAAVVRGAGRVVGCDIDAQAVFVARQIVRQQVAIESTSPRLVASTLSAVGARFDMVLCNMIPAEWIPFAAELPECLAPDGVLIVSGLLTEHRSDVERALRDVGLRPTHWQQKNDWWSVTARLAR